METGLLVPPDKPQALAKALITLLKGDDLLVRIRKGLQSAKKSLLTWRQVCRRLNEVYKEF